MHQAQEPAQWTHNPFAKLTEKQMQHGAQVDYIKVVAPGFPAPVLELDPEFCSDTGKNVRMRIPMHSAIGTQYLLVDYGTSMVFTNVDIKIGERKLKAVSTTRPAKEFLKKACLSYQEHHLSVMVEADTSVLDAVRSWAEATASDCEIVFNDKGTYCKLPMLSAKGAREQLLSIKSKMIRRWSRQPYQLSHRLAMTLNLAEADLSRDRDRRLAAICRVIGASESIELPLAMTVPKLQASICEPSAPDKTAAIQIALFKSVAEIDFLKQLFERTSRLGTVGLRIPSDQIPEKRIFVNLYPMDDVAEGLREEAAKLWGGTTDHVPASCWHPLFGERDDTLYLARYLDLTGDSANSECDPLEAPAPTSLLSPAKYIADSITSETEFVVDNFRGKVLRLPKGSYTYTMQPLPSDPRTWDDAAAQGPQSSGTIAWKARRPMPLIRTW